MLYAVDIDMQHTKICSLTFSSPTQPLHWVVGEEGLDCKVTRLTPPTQQYSHPWPSLSTILVAVKLAHFRKITRVKGAKGIICRVVWRDQRGIRGGCGRLKGVMCRR